LFWRENIRFILYAFPPYLLSRQLSKWFILVFVYLLFKNQTVFCFYVEPIFFLMTGIRILSLLFYFSFIHAHCVGSGNDLVSHIQSKAIPFQGISDIDIVLDMAAGKQLVLLGEASHGTHEYYVWRDSISRELISRHGFRFIAVEGDWASLYELNRYVRNMPGAANSAREVLINLDRWPQWMWGNEEVMALAEWLKEYNDRLPDSLKVGFYGMDVYDEWRSKDVLLDLLQTNAPDLYRAARGYFDCYSLFERDSWLYARSVASGVSDCSGRMEELVSLIMDGRSSLAGLSDYEYFNLYQNAMVFKYAEKFYRKTTTRRDASSWNSRVTHMHLTVSRLLELYGEGARGIVWAHNTHIGDARYTDMAALNQVNIGQLSREQHGPDNVLLVGFGTFRGTVQAGSSWGSRRQKMRIPRAISGSFEKMCYNTGLDRFLLYFDDEDRNHPAFTQAIGHRAVGVVYNPQNDFRQFVRSVVPYRYDAFMYFNETSALTPLH
jgi:erythromycin esterase